LTCRIVLVRNEGERGTHCQADIAWPGRIDRPAQRAGRSRSARLDSARSALPGVREPVS